MKRTTIVLIAALFGTFSLGGCSQEEVEKLKRDLLLGEADLAKAQRVVDDAKAELDVLAKQVEELPAGEQKVKATEQLAQARMLVQGGEKYIGTIRTRLSALNVRLEMVDNGPDMLQEITGEIGEALPPPFGMYLSLGGLLAAIIWRGVKNRTAAREIAASVDTILTDEQKAQIKGQSDKARAIVDEAQSKKFKLPL